MHKCTEQFSKQAWTGLYLADLAPCCCCGGQLLRWRPVVAVEASCCGGGQLLRWRPVVADSKLLCSFSQLYSNCIGKQLSRVFWTCIGKALYTGYQTSVLVQFYIAMVLHRISRSSVKHLAYTKYQESVFRRAVIDWTLMSKQLQQQYDIYLHALLTYSLTECLRLALHCHWD